MKHTNPLEDLELLVRYDRHRTWMGVVYCVFFCICAVVALGFEGSVAAGFIRRHFGLMFLVLMFLGFASMGAMRRAANIPFSSPVRKAAREDELYKASSLRASQNGLVVAILLQPALAVTAHLWPMTNDHIFMAIMTAALSLLAVCISQLYLDR